MCVYVSLFDCLIVCCSCVYFNNCDFFCNVMSHFCYCVLIRSNEVTLLCFIYKFLFCITVMNHCQGNWTYFRGNCYYFGQSAGINWSDAQRQCYSMSSTMLSIRDAYEQSFIGGKFDRSSCFLRLTITAT